MNVGSDEVRIWKDTAMVARPGFEPGKPTS